MRVAHSCFGCAIRLIINFICFFFLLFFSVFFSWSLPFDPNKQFVQFINVQNKAKLSRTPRLKGEKCQTHSPISSYFISFEVVDVVVFVHLVSFRFPVFRPNSSVTIFTFIFASFCSFVVCFSFAYPYLLAALSLSPIIILSISFVSVLRRAFATF